MQRSMKTDRLYHHDSFLLTFDARVVAHTPWEGAPSMVLDRTAFYPESGGQLGDRGALGNARVLDVQVDDSGAVHHLIDGAMPEVGAAVRGEIDRARRRI